MESPTPMPPEAGGRLVFSIKTHGKRSGLVTKRQRRRRFAVRPLSGLPTRTRNRRSSKVTPSRDLLIAKPLRWRSRYVLQHSTLPDKTQSLPGSMANKCSSKIPSRLISKCRGKICACRCERPLLKHRTVRTRLPSRRCTTLSIQMGWPPTTRPRW